MTGAGAGAGGRAPAGRRVTLLTGGRGAGKSTVCLRMGELARGAGIAVAGIASQGVFRQGARVGLEAVDLATGEHWLLASTVEQQDGPAVGPFSFSLPGLQRALAALDRALDRFVDPAVQPETGLFILDEVGPLEIARRQGFFPVVARLRIASSPDLLVVVRPELVGELRAALGEGRFTVVEVTRDSRDALPERLLAAVGAGPG